MPWLPDGDLDPIIDWLD